MVDESSRRRNGLSTRESITFARENAGEREAVVDKRNVLVDALRRNLGLTTYEAVVDEFARNIENGNLIRITRNPGIDEVTTFRLWRWSKATFRQVIAGKGTQTAPMQDEQLEPVLRGITERQRITLNDRQRKR